MNIQELVKTKQCTVVDVRSPEEFQGGHVPESHNIPLQDIPNQLEKLKEITKPLILCCASGNRSGQAQRFLLAQGIECYNGGSWMDVNF
jgi:rhodanese-related sulfurtransferase